MSSRTKINQRLAGATEAELQRLRRIYAGDKEAVKAIDEKLKPTPKRAPGRTTPK